MTDAADMVCVILAGGQGKRMASAGLHKVCFPIAGRPAIVRAIDVYKQAGLRRFLVVVGQKAEQVMSTISAAHPEVAFVHQFQPRGTGHAGAVAADALAAQGYDGSVLVVMGDKVTRPSVVERLLGTFRDGQCDVVMTTLPKETGPTAGRVVTDSNGQVRGIVEVPDLENARKKRTKLPLGGQQLTPAHVERHAASVNASMYVFRFGPLREALSSLQSGNAQGELYLTDTIEALSHAGRVKEMLVPDPDDLMAFNTPAELLAIEEVVRKRQRAPRVRTTPRRRLSGKLLKPAGKWLEIIEGDSPTWLRRLRRSYGTDPELLHGRRQAMKTIVQAFMDAYGADREMVLCRAPGRVNLMGRHVDHRGGFVNVVAISREALLAAAPRDDDVVRLRNVDASHFPPREFRIFDLVGQASWTEWIDFVNSSAVRQVLAEGPGDWSHYARAPLLRLQHECRSTRLCGMDCMVAGDIPIGAGLSSSSALVVAFAEAAVAMNHLDVEMRDFIDLCGEGEWFVGSRGGSADHAAIRTSRIGQVSRIGFFPFRPAGEVTVPGDLRIVVAHSGSQAVKSAGARDVFNQRVACYEIAQLLLRRSWPPAAGAAHLRDLTPDRLKVLPGEVYRALMHLPPRPSRSALRRLIAPADRDRLEAIFATHASQGAYDLRGAALFGLGEIIRSERFAERMRVDDRESIGRYMRTSHDGDRRYRMASDGRMKRYMARLTDASLSELSEQGADLAEQPGRYACSTEAIDHLVDLALATEGVVGAQLAGAGLGGCMMVLVEADALERLLNRFRKMFYKPRKLRFAAHVCTPVAGTELLGI
jgi:N-acetylgalactosamine kinase